MNAALRMLFSIMLGAVLSTLVRFGIEDGDRVAILSALGIIAGTGLALSWAWFLAEGKWR